MANDVYRANEASLVLAVDDQTSEEGKVAASLVTKYNLSNTIGRLQGVMITVVSDLKPFFEIGRRYPTQLGSGNVQTTGTIRRAYINGALLRLLLGDGANSPPKADFAQPSFNIIATLQDIAHPTVRNKIIVFGAKFAQWHYSIPMDDFVMESVTFQALRVSYEES
ncbi:MAG TPA: hypothetical protein VKY85_05865 [Candidatus Angelobacter sp.]|nr:hypothetical protein [Candidatus Angelobacter sp.]